MFHCGEIPGCPKKTGEPKTAETEGEVDGTHPSPGPGFRKKVGCKEVVALHILRRLLLPTLNSHWDSENGVLLPLPLQRAQGGN